MTGGHARNLWENIESRKLTNQILWEVILNCRKIRVKQNDETIQNILTVNGCGLINGDFYLCPTIAIAMSLCENYGLYIESKYLETRFVVYMYSIWGSANPFSKKLFLYGRLRDIIKVGVKHVLREAESQWMNVLQLSQNNS